MEKLNLPWAIGYNTLILSSLHHTIEEEAWHKFIKSLAGLEGYTFVFELGTQYNQVVIYHNPPKVSLLAIIHNKTYQEPLAIECDSCCSHWHGLGLNISRPTPYILNSLVDIEAFFKQHKPKGSEFEGFVIKDCNGLRIKIKNQDYLRLHRLKNNNNIFLLKNLVPLLVEEHDDLVEARLYFKGVDEKCKELQPKLAKIKERAYRLWCKAERIKTRKDFAFEVKDTDFAPIMFNLRNSQDKGELPDFDRIWKEYGMFIYEKFFQEKINAK